MDPTLDEQDLGTATVLKLAGELDLATRRPLQAACRRLAACSWRGVVVDTSAVTFLDCGTVTVLEQLARALQVQRRPGVTVVTDRQVRRVLELTGYAAQHRLVPSLAEGIVTVSAARAAAAVPDWSRTG